VTTFLLAVKAYMRLNAFKNVFDRVWRLLFPKKVAKTVEIYVLINGEFKKVEHMFLKVSEKLPLSLVIKDSQGNPAKVDVAPKWSLSDESLAALEVSEDGLSAVLVPSGSLGSFAVQALVDADLGEGVKELLGELLVDLVSGEAVSVEISAGAPEPK
jgi:hypothetical protein